MFVWLIFKVQHNLWKQLPQSSDVFMSMKLEMRAALAINTIYFWQKRLVTEYIVLKKMLSGASPQLWWSYTSLKTVVSWLHWWCYPPHWDTPNIFISLVQVFTGRTVYLLFKKQKEKNKKNKRNHTPLNREQESQTRNDDQDKIM